MLRARNIFLLACLVTSLSGSQVFACATCYGASDSPMAQGMNMGILVLLGFIGMVLTGVVAFFVHVGRNSAKLAGPGLDANKPDKLT